MSDFVLDIYRYANPDLRHFGDEQLMSHYEMNGIHENRICNKTGFLEKYQSLFQLHIYKQVNNDLSFLNTDEEYIIHYLKIGKNEKRIAHTRQMDKNMLLDTIDFDSEIYKLLNGELYYYTPDECMHHLLEGNNLDCSRVCIKSLLSNNPDIDFNLARACHKEYSYMSDNDLGRVFLEKGIYENKIFYWDIFYLSYPEFDIDYFRAFNPGMNKCNNYQLVEKYINQEKGIQLKQIINLKTFFQMYPEIREFDIKQRHSDWENYNKSAKISVLEQEVEVLEKRRIYEYGYFVEKFPMFDFSFFERVYSNKVLQQDGTKESTQKTMKELIIKYFIDNKDLLTLFTNKNQFYNDYPDIDWYFYGENFGHQIKDEIEKIRFFVEDNHSWKVWNEPMFYCHFPTFDTSFYSFYTNTVLDENDKKKKTLEIFHHYLLYKRRNDEAEEKSNQNKHSNVEVFMNENDFFNTYPDFDDLFYKKIVQRKIPNIEYASPSYENDYRFWMVHYSENLDKPYSYRSLKHISDSFPDLDLEFYGKTISQCVNMDTIDVFLYFLDNKDKFNNELHNEKEFLSKYPGFDINVYILMYDITLSSTLEIYNYFLNDQNRSSTIYTRKDLTDKYPGLDEEFYMEAYCDVKDFVKKNKSVFIKEKEDVVEKVLSLIHYSKFGEKEKRFINEKTFSKKYPSFDEEFIQNMYSDLDGKSLKEIIYHYIQKGFKEDRLYSTKQFYQKYPYYDDEFYTLYYPELADFSDNERMAHYHITGKKSGFFCSAKKFYDKYVKFPIVEDLSLEDMVVSMRDYESLNKQSQEIIEA